MKKIKNQLLLLFIAIFLSYCITNPDFSDDKRFLCVSGNNQRGATGVILRDLIVVRLQNVLGKPIPGIEVKFSVVSGKGSIAKRSVSTDALGLASTGWTLGIGQEQILKAEIPASYQLSPIYIYANSHLEIKTKWVTGIVFNANGTSYNHDNRILESNHFLTFSDGVSDDIKIIYSKMAEESLFELVTLLNFGAVEEQNIYKYFRQNKIKIYSITNLNMNQFSFIYGFMLYGMDSQRFKNWRVDDFWLRREIKHEMMHVIQFLVSPEWRKGIHIDTWFTEGAAEYLSGGCRPPIETIARWNLWRQRFNNDNPVRIRYWNDFNVPFETTGEYYPAFALAVRYLIDSKGLGKNAADLKEILLDMRKTKDFAVSFEKVMGISVNYYENNFVRLIEEYLQKL
ncbi:Ig-like domain-containing protein [candidate division KSB1 bacterium]|nr:Ig-like domain-containing protein [candidate division KSB1 bacterium]